MISAIAILFGTLVAGNSCIEDLGDARKDLAQFANGIEHAVAQCRVNHTGCTAEINGVTKYLGAAGKSVRDAVTDCVGQEVACIEEIGHISKNLWDITKIVDKCTNGTLKCWLKALPGMRAVSAVVNGIIHATKDCVSHQLRAPTTTLLAEPISVYCEESVEDVKDDLSDYRTAVFTAIFDCFKDEHKCDEDISGLQKQIEETIDDIKQAEEDCGGSTECTNEIDGLVEVWHSSGTVVFRVLKDCVTHFANTCYSDMMEAAYAFFSAANDIIKVTSACTSWSKNKIVA